MAQAAAPAKPKTSILQIEITKAKVKRDELMHLSRQLGAFVKAGLPLIEAVRILGEESKNKTVRHAMFDIEESLRGG
jgi:type IV pilus assembly protein PilC